MTTAIRAMTAVGSLISRYCFFTHIFPSPARSKLTRPVQIRHKKNNVLRRCLALFLCYKNSVQSQYQFRNGKF